MPGGRAGKIRANFWRPRKNCHEDSLGTWGRATEAVVVVTVAWAREISATFASTPAWVHGYTGVRRYSRKKQSYYAVLPVTPTAN